MNGTRTALFISGPVVLVSACTGLGITTPPPVPPVPGTVFSTLCTAFAREEGFDPAIPTIVLRKTRPIHETFGLRLLFKGSSPVPAELEEDETRDARLKAAFRPSPIVPTQTPPCQWKLASRPDAEYLGAPSLLLELSNPVANPFAVHDLQRWGIFAKHSYGGAGSVWYWVTLERRGTAWVAAGIDRLDISEM